MAAADEVDVCRGRGAEYQPIERYGIIGNARSVALIGMDGSIDWHCHPHFDSVPVFFSLLDAARGGRFVIAPVAAKASHKQLYWPGTNVLVTRIFTPDGIGELEDFMPMSSGGEDLDGWRHTIVRRVRCMRGSIKFRAYCRPTFDWGRRGHDVLICKTGATFSAKPSACESSCTGSAVATAATGCATAAAVASSTPVAAGTAASAAVAPPSSTAAAAGAGLGPPAAASDVAQAAMEDPGASKLLHSDAACLHFCLSTTVPLVEDGSGGVSGEFTLSEGAGNTQVFVFRAGEDGGCTCPLAPSPKAVERAFEATVQYWQRWLAGCTYTGRWREHVMRSALVLKLLTFAPTGAMVAAPTTSLPEAIGGIRNWDYRFCWLRDAAFTVYAFLRLGFRDEADRFMHWIHTHVTTHASETEPLPPLFTIHGDDHTPEIVLSELQGYAKSAPVRVGNAAVGQFQNDVYGELIDAVYLHDKYVAPVIWDRWQRLRARCDWICEHWQDPDEGIWEVRGPMRHYVYSKVMNWVALDRAIRLSAKRSLPCDHERWARERDKIYEEVMDRGWNAKLNSFTMAYGSEELDAAVLVMPLVLFISASDPRMLGTIDAIMKPPSAGGLTVDGLVYRYTPSPMVDGLPGEEGTFSLCSFWLVEACARAGHVHPDRLTQARLLFEKALSFSNHLGLYSEQTGREGQSLGNYPQAFTHLAMISAAFSLDRALNVTKGGTVPSTRNGVAGRA